MEEVSIFTSLGLVLTTLISVYLFFKTSNKKKILYGIIIWMILVGILGVPFHYPRIKISHITVTHRFIT